MAGKIQSSDTPLGRWLRNQDVSITQLAKDIDASYRTVWLAVHGYRVSYETARKICKYTGKGSKINVESFCLGTPRSEFEPMASG